MTKAEVLAMHLINNDLALPIDLIATLNSEGCIIHEFENSIIEGDTYAEDACDYYP
jgi:hypothetical protein